jgi:cytochrome P450
LIKDCAGSNKVEWMRSFAMKLPTIVALKLCGFPIDEHEKIKSLADHGVALLSGVNSAEEFAVHVAEALDLLGWVR